MALSAMLFSFLMVIPFATAAPPSSWSVWRPQNPSTVSVSTSTSASASMATSGSANPPPYLNELAKTAGKLYFGSATDQPGTGEDNDTAYQAILNDTRIFGQITPANGMKGFATEPGLGLFNYTMGQVAVDIAQEHGKILRCHNLIWASQQPEWLTSYNWTRETLLPQMRNHIHTLITHWSDACYAWDVVNEAFASNGTLSASPWLDVIGPDYIYFAYQYAHEAVQASGRDIKLYYNDYGIESPSPKVNAVYQLITDLREHYSIEIAIGLESHFTVGDTNTKANQRAVMQRFQNLGVQFALTELDVRFPALPPNATYTVEAQNFRYWESVSACMQFENCVGVTVWDFTDKYSWIPATFKGEGDACLYDVNLQRKEAYVAVAEALQRKECSVCGGNV